ncbi:hypothetical protein C6Q15_21790 [Burkholderia multivorans]|uniref:Uncharacterized protein n=1 Tax=Burkholderia multivorans TaxID=87883 RepID=A0A2S9MHC3_9BURK|nr:hypothetical protein C6Q15_21790 [Burkholderia multivorans]
MPLSVPVNRRLHEAVRMMAWNDGAQYIASELTRRSSSRKGGVIDFRNGDSFSVWQIFGIFVTSPKHQVQRKSTSLICCPVSKRLPRQFTKAALTCSLPVDQLCVIGYAREQ